MPRTEDANQQIREERRIQFLEISTKVFASKGFTDTRMSDIAAATGLSQGLVYRYFSSKEGLFGEVIRVTTCFMEDINRRALEQPGKALDKLKWWADTLLPCLYRQPEGAQVILHALVNAGVPENIRQFTLAYSDRLQAFARRLIEQGQTEGEFIQRDPGELTILLLSTLQGLSVTAGYVNYPVDCYPDTDIILRILRPD